MVRPTDNPLVRAIRRLKPGVIVNIVFQEARQQGYLRPIRPLVLVVCGGRSSRDLHAGRSRGYI